MREFWRLDSERQLGQGVIGRIPWSRIIDRARKSAIGGDEVLEDLFCQVIEHMDRGFMEWMSKEHDRHVRMRRPPPGEKASAGPVRRERRQR